MPKLRAIDVLTMAVALALGAGVCALGAYWGYQRKGVGGAIVMAAVAAVFLYYVVDTWLLPALGGIAKDTRDAIHRYEEHPSLAISKRLRGKDHQFDFHCKRCGTRVRIIALVDPRHTVPCTQCGMQHRINLV